MPEFCTCGAQLPPDARFCHKCGKPQREEDVPVVEVHEPAPEVDALIAQAAAAIPPEAVSLRNRYAVRSALLAGVAAFFLSAPLGPLGLFALIAGGWFAVFLYRKSTGQSISVANGARLGWITGVFLFVLLLLTFTASLAMQPTFFADFEAQIATRSELPQAEVREIIAAIQTPMGIAALVFGMFLTATLPTAVGGAVGAKLLRRD